ncbi:MAG: erythromycin biosynthesis sensory transduction protein eryC1 [Candidatus Lloydbacteria bacterium RIFCSPHIGHO2_02_FULL_54_17]|uniref:Erythromycin biosynthesis sensory transduction protein eryC1 n=1 Tax=Candidatus Lloydbacteria bacterium RIFCSPHIGHO2_02_FULL_54_17 TaxID=1798664 RepID=A0A1G2DEQ2_9BACT|nr:MAG: erythromycin biosynthesis sensory transduction protein eryC1 [Candidatus Lloydbacteria bacterium RIFCSPHIGHO2_02_FULL_54_17]OGZ13838.1 MAG: erythromycin biosynthesis sensory transduction protein eryC1 [Candidatus Lloydbacteria bacterium RIFCSPLOWO2_01_FULL_54_18]OGZ15555.1 MAG: erythromycin biosynthesis sensory transduction protein eryC1 [Candidatus Lloydbacteria bacterium RIFCSPLOWO2_02_FULL_54_12]
MHIPLVDLGAQYRSIKNEIDAAIANVIARSAYVGGTFVEQFEREFAAAVGAKHCIGVGNGTDALLITLKALGVGAGDEVIVPANTFIATAEVVSALGAHVVFVDVREDDFCLDVDLVRKKITKKTKVIIPVHLYGMPASMDQLLALAREHGILILEDTAQAHLATYNKRTVGTLGVAGTFSFYPGKNLGAYGDAGAIVTNDGELATKCRMFANHGRAKDEKYDHQIEGCNSRLDGLQAAVLSVKLKHLPEWTKKRRAVAKKYTELLRDVPELVPPKTFAERESAYHLYVVRAKERDALRMHLKEEGIEAGVHYPIGLPYLNAYRHLELNKPDDFPVTYRLQSEILSLPIYAELSDPDLLRITDTIKNFYRVS